MIIECYDIAVILAGANVAYVCSLTKEAIEGEQSKTLWVPSPTPL